MKEDLEKLFNPETIAVIGASRDHNSVGYGILKNLLTGFSNGDASEYSGPFKGKIFPVNPNADEIQGLQCYPSILKIKETIDLAIISVPAKIVAAVMKECAIKKVKFAIIISAGFGEIGEEGKKLQDEVVEIARKGNIRIIGPNCLGIIRTENSMNASFAPSMPPKGEIAFISQSGALADSIIDWAIEKRYGFSTVISYGNKADLDTADLIEYFGNDKHTKAIALYVEGINDGRRFMEIASKVSKKKPIIALKSGRSEAGAKAVSSHTGSLAGSYQIYEAAFNQCGIIMALNVEEMFDIAKALAYQPVCKENSVAIVTNAGGPGVLCSDYCEMFGVNLAQLKDSTIKKLDASGKMHPAYSRRNPLDIVGDALPERYEAALNILLDENYISGIIIIQTLQTMTNPEEDAKIIIEANKKHPEKPILCTYMGGKLSKKGREMLEDSKIPDYNDPKKTAKAMSALIKRAEFLKRK
jgi:acetate---CoA ligase (ADP-forming)